MYNYNVSTTINFYQNNTNNKNNISSMNTEAFSYSNSRVKLMATP